MKIRTELDLQQALDGDFAWRLREIHYAKDQVRTAPVPRKQTTIRGAVPILYAHWEGFVKAGAEAFVRFVEAQRRPYRELLPCFVVHGMAAKVHMLSDAKSHRRRVECLRFILKELDSPARFATKNIVRTKGNLSSEVFSDIASAIGIDPSRYSSRFNLIDVSLLKRRNSIAHGEWLDLDESALTSLADEVLILLRWFKTDVENHVATKSYLA